MFKFELKRAFNNNLFRSAMAVCMIISVYSAVAIIINYNSYTESLLIRYENDPRILLTEGAYTTVYNNWIGSDNGFLTTLYYMVIFFLVYFPYSWSLYSDKKSGYINHLLTKTNRSKYFFSKYIATFLSGGALAVIPIITNFIICACFIPAITPNALYKDYYDLPQNFPLSSYFYSEPMIFILYAFALIFIFAGLWATVGITISLYIKNKIAIFMLPFLFLLALLYVNIGIFDDAPTIELFSLSQAYVSSYLGIPTVTVMCSWIVAIILISYITYLTKVKNKDVLN